MGTLFQFRGIGMLGPIYYLIEYLQVPLPQLLTRNLREIEPSTAISLTAALVAGHYLPTFANFLVPKVEDRRWWNAVWQIFPLTVPLIQLPLSILGKRCAKPTHPKSRERDTKDRMRGIRIAYRSMAVISALTFLYARRSAPPDASLASIFWPGLKGHLLPVQSFTEGIARFLQYDQVLSMASGFIWLGLRFRELKACGASFSWWKTISALVGTTCAFGPGTAFVVGWGWKEEMLNEMPVSN